MTELRDARLRKALDEAPDAALRPQPRTREAIRVAAQAAVEPAWRRWWRHAGDHRMPWTAAFATVVLATLVTVMWEGREVPGVRPEAQAPAPAPASGSTPAPAPPSAPAPVPAPPPAPAAARAPTPAPATASPRAPARARETLAPPPAAPGAGRASEEAPAPPAAADAVARAPAAPAAQRPPQPPPAAPAAPAAPRPAAPSAPQAALRASPAALPWTQVRIEAGGRSVAVGRMQASELAALVTSVLASPSDEADSAAVGTLRLELAQGDETLGALEVVGDRWRWTPLRDARGARLLLPDPGLASALREEAQRLLAR